jgi:hypothetical protein
MSAVGYEHLRQRLGLSALPRPCPAVVRAVTRIDANAAFIAVPAAVAPAADDLLGHVLFALKHEGTDLQMLAEALPHIDAERLVEALRQTPSGRYLRLAGYLWEAFTGRELAGLPELRGATVPVFDPARYVTLPGERSARWRVEFNGLGSLAYCATVRRTAAVEAGLAADVLGRVGRFARSTEQPMLDRALSWAYLGETRASFEIENETPSPDKSRLFVDLLRHAHAPRPLTEDYLVELQCAVVSNPFDQAAAFRQEQNYLQTGGAGALSVSYVPPPPEQIGALMRGLMDFANTGARGLDPLVAAACISFGFVFIHPFMDGNGRLSRFLFHHALCQSGRLPDGLILPVSIAMARHEADYLAALETYSRPLRERWDVRMLDVGQFDLRFNGAASLYRYWDATACVEFGMRMAEAALTEDLQDQVVFTRRYDRIVRDINARFDIRNNILSTLVLSALQQGRVSQRRRDQFAHAVPEAVFDAIEQALVDSGNPDDRD